MFLVGIAVAVPNLEDIIPLVGISAGMVLAFVLPPFLEIVTFWETWCLVYSDQSWKVGLRVIKNGFLMLLGIVGVISGLIVSIQNLI